MMTSSLASAERPIAKAFSRVNSASWSVVFLTVSCSIPTTTPSLVWLLWLLPELLKVGGMTEDHEAPKAEGFSILPILEREEFNGRLCAMQ